MTERVGEVVSKAKVAFETPKALVESLTGMATRLDAMDTVIGIMAQQFGEVREQLVKGEKISTLLTESHTMTTEAVGVLHTQGMDLQQQLDRLNQRLGVPAAAPTWWQQWWRAVATGGVVVVLSAGVAWWWWPEMRWQPLGLKLDAAVVEQWPALSKVHERFLGIYSELRIKPPSERQQKAKQ